MSAHDDFIRFMTEELAKGGGVPPEFFNINSNTPRGRTQMGGNRHGKSEASQSVFEEVSPTNIRIVSDTLLIKPEDKCECCGVTQLVTQNRVYNFRCAKFKGAYVLTCGQCFMENKPPRYKEFAQVELKNKLAVYNLAYKF